VTAKSKSVFKRLSASISRWTRKGGASDPPGTAAAAASAGSTSNTSGLAVPSSPSFNAESPVAGHAGGLVSNRAACASTSDTPTAATGDSAGRSSGIRGTALSVRNGILAAAATMAGGYGV
jgi:hypothetical protein